MLVNQTKWITVSWMNFLTLWGVNYYTKTATQSTDFFVSKIETQHVIIMLLLQPRGIHSPPNRTNHWSHIQANTQLHTYLKHAHYCVPILPASVGTNGLHNTILKYRDKKEEIFFKNKIKNRSFQLPNVLSFCFDDKLKK